MKLGHTATLVKIVNNSPRAINARAKRLRKAFRVLRPSVTEGIAKFYGLSESQKRRMLRKQLDAEQRANDLQRSGMDIEFWHTLVKDGVNPIRHQMMTRLQARKLNEFNTSNEMKLRWMIGRQELK